MKIPIQVEPANGASRRRIPLDRDTEILSAQLNPRTTGKGMSGSVEVEGSEALG